MKGEASISKHIKARKKHLTEEIAQKWKNCDNIQSEFILVSRSFTAHNTLSTEIRPKYSQFRTLHK